MDAQRLGVELDPTVNALYVRLAQGTVARTIEVSPLVLVDIDEHGTTLGYEFVNADQFLPYLRAHGGELPPVEVGKPTQRIAV